MLGAGVAGSTQPTSLSLPTVSINPSPLSLFLLLWQVTFAYLTLEAPKDSQQPLSHKTILSSKNKNLITLEAVRRMDRKI